MSIQNEEEFKIYFNNKIYLINICILEDQLSLVLTLLVQPPRQYSGFFSLNELRISSKIFHHTNSLFEAKEIIKRTVIKKQLLINEDEHRARITFDPGLGNDSLPFPIILFRDLNVNHLAKSQTLEDFKKYNEMNNRLKLIQNNHLIKNKNFLNNQNGQQKFFLKQRIGSNINNKMILNNNINKIISHNNNLDKINENFNNDNPQLRRNYIEMNKNNKINNNIDNLPFKKVDLTNNMNLSKGIISQKDYIEMNNQILYNIYNNINKNNNINSSFYKNWQNNFISNEKDNENNSIKNNININTGVSNNIINKDQLHNNNKNFNPSLIKQNLNLNELKNNDFQNSQLNNLNNNNIQYNNKNNINNFNQKKVLTNNNNNLNGNFNNQNIRGSFFTPNQSFKTAPIERNITRIPNNDKMDFNFNKKINKTIPAEGEKNGKNNKNEETSEESEEESNEKIDENIDEEILEEKIYRFKNLEIDGSEKVKGNLEKFKESQNLGDYVPSGMKFISYLKFPDRKSNISSNNASTLSSSLTSSSNIIPGIDKNIVKNPAELEEVTAHIKRILNKRNLIFKIIFKGTEHGDLSSTFHKKCDKIQNTLVLIHTSCNKRFGGFTTQTWDGKDINKKDDNCFIFSIDKMKIYDIIIGHDAINCNPDYGPVFIDQIKLLNKFFTQGGTTSYKGKTFKTLENFEITEGAEKFGIKEVEVYQVK